MLRHIVMIKFNNNVDISIVSKELMVMLEELEQYIKSLLKIEVGINISKKASAYDIVLSADFNDEKGLDEYRIHPEHVKVLDYLNVVMEKVVVIDYFI